MEKIGEGLQSGTHRRNDRFAVVGNRAVRNRPLALPCVFAAKFLTAKTQRLREGRKESFILDTSCTCAGNNLSGRGGIRRDGSRV